MLCKAGYGGARDTVRSRLVTDNADVFQRDFYEALANPEPRPLRRRAVQTSGHRSITKAWMALVKPLPSRKKSDVVTYSREPVKKLRWTLQYVVRCSIRRSSFPKLCASVKAQTCPPEENRRRVW